MRTFSDLFRLYLFLGIVRIASASTVAPNWPLEVLSWDIDKAYPGIEYNYRLAVRGGEYPYEFSIVKGPTGMKIDKAKGTLTWIAPGETAENEVSVSIIDSKGKKLTHTFKVKATKEGFYFVSKDGNNSNKGSESSPWATMAYASTKAGVKGYVYVKNGTYTETIIFKNGYCGRFLSYPGNKVTVLGNGAGKTSFSIESGDKLLFQGFRFDAMDHRWLFSVGSSKIQNIIWRNNEMFNAYSNDWENPAFIFFWDDSQTPINGQVHYKNMVMQENVFYNLENKNDHGASTTLYDVQDMLFEDNIVFDIDGYGVNDKDDGYMNTFRNNVIYDCENGIAMLNQGTEGYIDVSYNLIYRCAKGIIIGWQPGYLRDVYVHHNTIIGNIFFGAEINNNESKNINIYKNIIGDGSKLMYSILPIKASSDGSTYKYPDWFNSLTNKNIQIDSNILWMDNASGKVAGFSWGVTNVDMTGWKKKDFDVNGILTNPGLDSKFGLLPGSKYYGVYGRDLAGINDFPIDIPVGIEKRINFEKSNHRNVNLNNKQKRVYDFAGRVVDKRLSNINGGQWVPRVSVENESAANGVYLICQ